MIARNDTDFKVFALNHFQKKFDKLILLEQFQNFSNDYLVNSKILTDYSRAFKQFFDANFQLTK